jgi:histidinol-phosphatase (PHP family)
MHASNEVDEEYIKRAIELGAKSITFTDHAPFPGDPFGNRMKYEQLNEYVESLSFLKEKYKEKIDVKIGLEIEFLPSYIEYYKELKKSGKFDILMLGQHFYEIKPCSYSFSYCPCTMRKNEFTGCGQAIVEGINTGLFDVVAHPDRIFRRRLKWTEKMMEMSKDIIEAAKRNGVSLEQNASSMARRNCYWSQFWELAPKNMVVNGLDAHSTKELKLI